MPRGPAAAFADCPKFITRSARTEGLLVPLKELLIILREQVHKDDLAKGVPRASPSVPYMEEFLEFVCSDQEAVQAEGWPYQD